MKFRQMLLIARGVWLEAIRRKEIYMIVVISCLLLVGLGQVRFFGLESLSKFYRETALHVMSLATAFTVIVLASRQLPREFETRSIYPLLARPLHRGTFILGKLLGVWAAAVFCFGLFLIIYMMGCLSMGAPLYPMLLLQHSVLQVELFLVLASFCFLLSILVNLDAAITLGSLFYLLSTAWATLSSQMYEPAGALLRGVILVFTWLLPQFMLFDLSEKNVHGEVWGPVSWWVLGQLTVYALIFSAGYILITVALFQRRKL
ncbi:hypothetical protein P3T73_07935 [Kiritimatiellota bacterium B12222]|nr:hypothetical protein P3T73_07935 [Kiritimatiellota bacterium B12222]